MIKFIVGVVAGIFIATVGVAGIFKLINDGVTQIQDVSREVVK